MGCAGVFGEGDGAAVRDPRCAGGQGFRVVVPEFRMGHIRAEEQIIEIPRLNTFRQRARLARAPLVIEDDIAVLDEGLDDRSGESGGLGEHRAARTAMEIHHRVGDRRCPRRIEPSEGEFDRFDAGGLARNDDHAAVDVIATGIERARSELWRERNRSRWAPVRRRDVVDDVGVGWCGGRARGRQGFRLGVVAGCELVGGYLGTRCAHQRRTEESKPHPAGGNARSHHGHPRRRVGVT